MSEEVIRRRLVAERRVDINQAKLDEMKRRELHKKQIQLMKDEFNLYLKTKYPLIVGQKQIQDGDEKVLKQDIDRRKLECEQVELQLKNNMVDFVGSDIHKMKHIFHFDDKIKISQFKALEKCMTNNKLFK